MSSFTNTRGRCAEEAGLLRSFWLTDADSCIPITVHVWITAPRGEVLCWPMAPKESPSYPARTLSGCLDGAYLGDPESGGPHPIGVPDSFAFKGPSSHQVFHIGGSHFIQLTLRYTDRDRGDSRYEASTSRAA
jgi:hypothetical protein